MSHINLRLFPDGRIERSERVETWQEREELIAYALFLQPGLAALDIGARIWRDLRHHEPHPEVDSVEGRR